MNLTDLRSRIRRLEVLVAGLSKKFESVERVQRSGTLRRPTGIP